MLELADRLRRPWVASRYPGQIDMGNGRVIEPEDVLDGHFRHLLARRQAGRTQTVSVQVDSNLVAAITVLAPGLKPLTELAEEVADAVPAVQPAPHFRRHLHDALERTHRQLNAQRALGTRSDIESSRPQRRTAWLILAMTLVAIVGISLGRIRRRHAVIDSA